MARTPLFLILLCGITITLVSASVPLPSIDPFAPTAATIAFASYCGTKLNEKFNCYWCKQIPYSLEWVGNFGVSGSSIFGFVGLISSRKQIVISFRGTDNVQGWLTDGNFLQDPFPLCNGCLVHRGFWDAYQNSSVLIKVLWLRAVSLCPSCDSTLVTGHSLGAAIATVAALDLQAFFNNTPYLHNNTNHNWTLTNFGSPRVGNAAFAQYANAMLGNFQRYTHKRDPVPVVPPTWVNYHHSATEIWQDTNGNYHLCDSSGEDPSCIDSTSTPNPIDHATYVGVDVLFGVPFGCMWIDP